MKFTKITSLITLTSNYKSFLLWGFWSTIIISLLAIIGLTSFTLDDKPVVIDWNLSQSTNYYWQNNSLIYQKKFSDDFSAFGGQITLIEETPHLMVEGRVSLDGKNWEDWRPLEALEPEDRPDFTLAKLSNTPFEFQYITKARWLQLRLTLDDQKEQDHLHCSADSNEVNQDTNQSQQKVADLPSLVDQIFSYKNTFKPIDQELKASIIKQASNIEIDAIRYDTKASKTTWAYPEAQAAVNPSAIIPRSAWNTGCHVDPNDEVLYWPPDYFKIDKIVVHHTVGGDSVSTLEQGKQQVNAICRYHAFSRGWGDIGYNYLIDQQGYIYEGRAGGEGVEGGHAYGANKGSVGIAMIGTYTYQNITPAAEQSLEKLVAELSQRYQFSPTSNTTLTRWCYSFTGPALSGHRDFATYYKNGYCDNLYDLGRPGATQCPGDVLYHQTLPQVRQNALNRNPLLVNPGVYVTEYYSNSNLSGNPVSIQPTGSQGTIDVNWANSPLPGMPVDGYSVRFRNRINIPENAVYQFQFTYDDGLRFFVDNNLQFESLGPNPQQTQTVEVGLSAGQHQFRIEYFDQSGPGKINLTWQKKNIKNSFVGTYYGNAVFTGDPFMVREDQDINFDWGTEDPAEIFGIGDDYYSVVWQGNIEVTDSSPYIFTMEVDDQARLYVNDMNTPLINAWDYGVGTYQSQPITLQSGVNQIKMVYVEHTGQAKALLSWMSLQGEAFTSSGGLLVENEDGQTLFQIPPNEVVRVFYADQSQKYVVNYQNYIRHSSSAIKLTPIGGSPPTVVLQDCPVRTHGGVQGCYSQYKTFRGQILIKASLNDQEYNIINRVNVEHYLLGTGETGANNEPEYTKTLVVSMRTNALNYASRGGKYPTKHYDVTNTTANQVYHGYGYEVATGSNTVLAQAVNETKQIVVTHPQSSYPDDLILATFFSQTGPEAQTCGWDKVGSCTWNVANNWHWIPESGAPDPWWEKNGQCTTTDNTGRTKLGHGYGISGRGAECYARMEGKNYQWIFQHYYNNVSLTNYPGGTSQKTIDVGIYARPFSGIVAPQESVVSLINGTLFQDQDGSYHLVENNVLKQFASTQVFLIRGYQSKFVQPLSNYDRDHLPKGPAVLFPEGTLIQDKSTTQLFLVENSQRRYIPTVTVLEKHNLHQKRFVPVSPAVINLHPPGPNLQ